MTERELDRRVARRLAIFRYHEDGHSVALTCRRYGIARETYYKWQRRYRALGVEGLRDRSTKPYHCPFAISPEAIDKIIYLRQNYHFGPLKLSMYLKRHHQLEISVSGVWRVLRRHHLNRLPSSQRYKPHKERWKLYEKPQPGQCLQVDVKFISPLAGRPKRLYQYTAIDDCTRLRVLRIYVTGPAVCADFFSAITTEETQRTGVEHRGLGLDKRFRPEHAAVPGERKDEHSYVRGKLERPLSANHAAADNHGWVITQVERRSPMTHALVFSQQPQKGAVAATHFSRTEYPRVGRKHWVSLVHRGNRFHDAWEQKKVCHRLW